MAEEDWYHLQRRANPPGWVNPREGSQYNPYDPHDKRPPGGYPSEFKPVGKVSSSGVVKTASQYQQMKETMKKLQYTPRPHSELYPGQYKTLRRTNNYGDFFKGANTTFKLFIIGVTVYGVFIYRWNEGYENVFSDFRRAQLKLKHWVLGELSQRDQLDLLNQNGHRGEIRVSQGVKGDGVDKDITVPETSVGLERPERKHLMEAQTRLQLEEERYLKALDIAEEQLRNHKEVEVAPKKRGWW